MMEHAKRKAVFMDRDGTLIVDHGYLSDPALVRFHPGVFEALALLRDAGFLLFVVTNQSGVGRGMFTMNEVNAVHAKMSELLAEQHVRIEKYYVAPETPGSPSRGRKPSPNLLIDAAREFNVELKRSFMIGDKVSDIECGINADVAHSYLVETGYGKQERLKLDPDRHGTATVCPFFSDVATLILSMHEQ